MNKGMIMIRKQSRLGAPTDMASTMRKQFSVGIALATLLVITAAPCAWATTVAQWMFDESSGDVFLDSSGSGFDLTATNPQPPGSSWSRRSDVPLTTSPPGVTSLKGLDPRVIDTASSDRFSLGKTGAMTMEFWYKDTPDASGVVDYVLSTVAAVSDNNRISVFLDGGDKINFFFFDNAGGTHSITTGAGSITEGAGWQHIAATFDTNVGSGEAFVYIDGSPVASTTTFGTNFAAFDAPFRVFGNGSAENFNGKNLIDELRMSDVALLPGSGTGVGELAWNTSLVPEPGTAILLGLGLVCLFRRRR